MPNSNKKHILVMGGNLREKVDTFRFYSNDRRAESQGAYIAKYLYETGADITFITSAFNLHTPKHIQVTNTLPDGRMVHSAADLCAAAKAQHAESISAVIQLANIPSITCAAPANHKIQKTNAAERAQLFDVVGNMDIAAELIRAFPAASIIGFNTHQEWFSHNGAGFAHDIQTLLSVHNPLISHNPIIDAALSKHVKATGKHVVVTTAPTKETLTQSGDIISNPFTGAQGQAIALAFAERGANVTVLSGETHLPDISHPLVHTIHVRTAKEMFEESHRLLESKVDAYIAAASVSDFSLEVPLALCLAPQEKYRLELEENKSIVASAAHHPNRPEIVVSFAAQSPEDIRRYAIEKFRKSGVDFTVANPIGEGTAISRDSMRNQVMIIDAYGVQELPEMSKREVGELIAERVTKQWKG